MDLLETKDFAPIFDVAETFDSGLEMCVECAVTPFETTDLLDSIFVVTALEERTVISEE